MLTANASTIKQYASQAQAGNTATANRLFDSFVPSRIVSPNPLAATPYVTPDPSIPLFLDGDAYADARQGGIGNCGLIAGLAEVAAKQPATIQNAIVDLGNGTYTVNYFAGIENIDVPGTPASMVIDRLLPTPYYADYSQELWVALLEKAAAIISPFYPAGYSRSYNNLVGMFPITAMALFTSDIQTFMPLDQFQFEAAYEHGWFLCLESQYAQPNGSPIVGNHAYSVLNYDAATQMLKLYNPWGFETYVHWQDVVTYFVRINAAYL